MVGVIFKYQTIFVKQEISFGRIQHVPTESDDELSDPSTCYIYVGLKVAEWRRGGESIRRAVFQIRCQHHHEFHTALDGCVQTTFSTTTALRTHQSDKHDFASSTCGFHLGRWTDPPLCTLFSLFPDISFQHKYSMWVAQQRRDGIERFFFLSYHIFVCSGVILLFSSPL